MLDSDVTADYLRRWDSHQRGFVPYRETGCSLMFDVIEKVNGTPRTLLDVGAGMGFVATQALRRWPDVQVTALELDPVLAALVRTGHAAEFGDRLTWAEVDIRQTHWSHQLTGTFDTICSATALHYLHPDQPPALAGNFAELSTPDGIFANFDTIAMDRHTPRLRHIIDQARETLWANGFTDGRETWDKWWESLQAEPDLVELFAERAQRFAEPPSAELYTLQDPSDAVYNNGFTEVGTVAQ